MTSFLPPDSINSFVPNDLIIPTNFDEANLVLTDYFRQTVDALNDKEIAQYSTTELVTGQKWFIPGDPNQYRFTYRKVIDFGALPNAATKSVAHGITTTNTTIFTRIFATATDPAASTVNQAIPIPYVDPNTLANGIEINVDATNVNITTAANYTAYTTTYVVLEYIQNAP